MQGGAGSEIASVIARTGLLFYAIVHAGRGHCAIEEEGGKFG